jgi:hypothetical protein
MKTSVEALWGMSDAELLAAYHEVRRLHAEKKFARDSERGRLQWLKGKTFVQTLGSVTERINAVDASEDLARKGQNLREMTLQMDLVRTDVEVIAECLRLRRSQSFDHGFGTSEDGDTSDPA